MFVPDSVASHTGTQRMGAEQLEMERSEKTGRMDHHEGKGVARNVQREGDFISFTYRKA